MRALGRTGIDVSAIGFGTIKIGRNRGMKYPEAYELPGDDVVDELLAISAEGGVTLMDTAPAYGTSEERLGAALRRRGDRDRWVLSTKVGEAFDGERSSFDFSPESVRPSVERSLQRLGTDRVELLLVHSDGEAETRLHEAGTLDAMRELRAAGLVRAIGVSVKTPEGGAHCLDAGVDALMIEYNPVERKMAGCIERCAAEGVGVLVKKALVSGHLDRVDDSADPVERAIGFSLENPGVSSVVIGTAKPANLRANLAAARRVLGNG
ncbi:MAG: aldo/keto reductase [Planctomycetota bacterium]